MSTQLTATDTSASHKIAGLVAQLVRATRRRPRRPSERNLRIYHDVRVRGVTQQEVAAFERLSQKRVSAICQQVERWRGEHDPAELGEAQTPAARQRSDRWLARQRMEEVYGWAMQGLRFSSGTLSTGVTRTGADGSKTWQNTTKENNYNVQWLKLARGAAQDLSDLGELPEPELPPKRLRTTQAERIMRVVACLRRTIRQASEQGSPDCLRQVVEAAVAALTSEGDRPVSEVPPAGAVSAPLAITRPDASVLSILNPPAKRTVAATMSTAPMVGASASPATTSGGKLEQNGSPKPAGVPREKNEFRTVSREAVSSPSAAPANPEEERRVLDELGRAYRLGMTREMADNELADYQKDQSRRHPHWSYSREQQAALEAWAGLSQATERRRDRETERRATVP